MSVSLAFSSTVNCRYNFSSIYNSYMLEYATFILQSTTLWYLIVPKEFLEYELELTKIGVFTFWILIHIGSSGNRTQTNTRRSAYQRSSSQNCRICFLEGNSIRLRGKSKVLLLGWSPVTAPPVCRQPSRRVPRARLLIAWPKDSQNVYHKYDSNRYQRNSPRESKGCRYLEWSKPPSETSARLSRYLRLG